MHAINVKGQHVHALIGVGVGALGVTAQVQTLEWPTMLDYAKKGNLDMFILGWTTVPPDADIGLSSLVLSENRFTGGNYTAYSNAQVDSLVKSARAESNTSNRTALYGEVLEILYDELPMIPLFHPYNNAVTQEYIEGFSVNYFSVHDIKTLSR